MRLNTIKPAAGAKKSAKRVGRGIGSTLGKTCGRGHKGQTSRSGGSIAPGFEGGQQPIYKRLPKFGFNSMKSQIRAEIRTSELNKVNAEVITVEALKESGLINKNIQYVKIMLSGEVNKPVVISGIKVSKGAYNAIIEADGKVEG